MTIGEITRGREGLGGVQSTVVPSLHERRLLQLAFVKPVQGFRDQGIGRHDIRWKNRTAVEGLEQPSLTGREKPPPGFRRRGEERGGEPTRDLGLLGEKIEERGSQGGSGWMSTKQETRGLGQFAVFAGTLQARSHRKGSWDEAEFPIGRSAETGTAGSRGRTMFGMKRKQLRRARRARRPLPSSNSPSGSLAGIR